MSDKGNTTEDLQEPLLANVAPEPIQQEEDVEAPPTPPSSITPEPEASEEFGDDILPLPPTVPIVPNGEEGDEALQQAPTSQVVVRAHPVVEAVEENSNLTVTGRWRNGLCLCCMHGCCHPSLICAWFCPFGKTFILCVINKYIHLYSICIFSKLSFFYYSLVLSLYSSLMFMHLVALAQVMKRFNLLISGKQGTPKQGKRTFWMLVIMFLLNIAYINLIQNLIQKEVIGIPLGNALYSFVPVLFSIFLIYLVGVTRNFIRQRYQIPERNCIGCEDCVCALCFPCCTISQMARHTTDYDTYRAVWFSDTGLPNNVASATV
jgi:hypothetical protein